MTKVLKDSVNGNSALIIEPENAIIASGANSVVCTSDAGNFINGPLSISSSFTSIRMGGIYKFNSLMASTMPSTVITPIPTLEIDLPVKETAGYMAVTSMVLSLAAG